MIFEQKAQVKRFISYMKKKKRMKSEANTSIDFTENHFANKNANIVSEKVIVKGAMNYMRKKNYGGENMSSAVNLEKKYLRRKICPQEESVASSIRTPTVPKQMKQMPLIPFWKSSFEMLEESEDDHIEVFSEDCSILLKRRKSVTPVFLEEDYITMSKRNEAQENIYV